VNPRTGVCSREVGTEALQIVLRDHALHAVTEERDRHFRVLPPDVLGELANVADDRVPPAGAGHAVLAESRGRLAMPTVVVGVGGVPGTGEHAGARR